MTPRVCYKIAYNDIDLLSVKFDYNDNIAGSNI